MYGFDNGKKLKSASKFIAGFLALGGIVIFIITFVVAVNVTLAVFILAFITLLAFVFSAWLSYHMLNAIGNATINSEIMMTNIEKLMKKSKVHGLSVSNISICASCGRIRENSISDCPYCKSFEVSEEPSEIIEETKITPNYDELLPVKINFTALVDKEKTITKFLNTFPPNIGDSSRTKWICRREDDSVFFAYGIKSFEPTNKNSPMIMAELKIQAIEQSKIIADFSFVKYVDNGNATFTKEMVFLIETIEDIFMELDENCKIDDGNTYPRELSDTEELKICPKCGHMVFGSVCDSCGMILK